MPCGDLPKWAAGRSGKTNQPIPTALSQGEFAIHDI